MSRVSGDIATLRASVEEEYLQDFKTEQPYDIYFELASIIAGKVIDVRFFGTESQRDLALHNLALKNAKDSYRYAVGQNAYQLDQVNNDQAELEKLMLQVKGN